MLRYNCESCKFSSKIKTHYTRHLKTNKHLKNTQNVVMSIVCDQKKPVKNQKKPEKNQNKPKKTTPIQNSEKKIDEKIEEKNITETFECHFCNTIFKTKYIKRRHELHRCKNNDAIINRNLKMKNNEINKLKNELTEERKNFKKQIELLLTKVGNTTINTTNTNNIQLNNYGHEDMSHITHDYKTRLLNIPYGMIPKMIEAVHFSDKKPENKNILLTNKKENKIKLYTNGKWIYKNKEETLNSLIDGKYFILDSHYENICNKLGEIEKIKKKNYENFRDNYDSLNKDVITQLKQESELVLLNNR